MASEGASGSPTLPGACRSCRLETPLVSFETDPACALCESTELGPTAPRFPSEETFRDALVRWQMRAGFDTLPSFVEATFVLGDAALLYRAYERRELLELVSDPFGFGGGLVHDRPETDAAPPVTSRMSNVPLISREADSKATLVEVPSAPRLPAMATLVESPAGAAALATSPGLSALRSRAPLYPLASVAAADGLVSIEERWFLDECLRRYGEPPAREDEIRVYPPLDWAASVPSALRAQVAFDMCTLAMIDGLPDAAEARMIYAYCIEWRIPTEEARKYLIQLQHKNTSFSRRIWLRLRDYLLPGRWENTQL